MAEIDEEGKIFITLFTIYCSQQQQLEIRWKYLDVLRSSRLNNEFYSNVVCKASFFSIKHTLQDLMCFPVVWRYGSGGGEMFYISVCTPSLYNITLTLQRFTHQSIKFLLSREWTVDSQGFCCALFLDNFIHDVRRARIKRRHVENYRIDSWPGSKARLVFNLVPRIFLFSKNEKTLGSSLLLSQPGKTGDIERHQKLSEDTFF